MFVQQERHRSGKAQGALARNSPRIAVRNVSPDPARAWRAVGNSMLSRLAERESAGTPSAAGGVRPMLQRACGCGGFCADCRRDEERPLVQPSVLVGPANDAYEEEAERVADRVTHMTAGVDADSQRSAPGIRIQPLALSAASAARTLDVDLPTGGGHPLAATTREFMEPRFRADFGSVRLHADPDAYRLAANVQARAFTYGQHIWLGAGQSEHDHRLMAHELTHVVQQHGGLTGDEQSSRLVQSASAMPSVQRQMSPELQEIESLLSYGLFDWAIRDKEALRALQLLKGLSRFQQAQFFTDPTLVERLRDNLPDSRRPELDAIEADVASIRPPTATVEDIKDKLSYGLFDWAITDEEAIQALELLKRLSGTDLAVALASIDYGRLMDNLPETRRKELIDLLAQGLSTGGARDVEEQENPGTVLKSITFTSDHGVMKDNDSNWKSSGDVRSGPGQTEWFVASNGKVVSNPISQSRDTNVAIDVVLNVLPVNAPAAPIRLMGRSPAGFLTFDFAGTMAGGLNQHVPLVSTGKLPDAIRAFPSQEVVWTMEWRSWDHEIGRTTHTIYVTKNAPRRPDEVTEKRMRTSVELVGAAADDAGTLDPHLLIRSVMTRWGAYNLDVALDNDWELADNLDRGAQCNDIVGFVQGMIETVGVEGTGTPVVVWARPGTPMVPEESIYPHGGTRAAGPHPTQPSWFLGLMDQNGCPNAFEAALRFEHPVGNLRYYPGGVPMDRDYLTAKDVLFIFQCLAWLTALAEKELNIEEILATYPGGSCSLGRIRCT